MKYKIAVSIILIIIVTILISCSTKEAPWKWEERQRVIPPPVCERVNTITSGKPAECKEEI